MASVWNVTQGVSNFLIVDPLSSSTAHGRQWSTEISVRVFIFFFPRRYSFDGRHCTKLRTFSEKTDSFTRILVEKHHIELLSCGLVAYGSPELLKEKCVAVSSVRKIIKILISEKGILWIRYWHFVIKILDREKSSIFLKDEEFFPIFLKKANFSAIPLSSSASGLLFSSKKAKLSVIF